MPRSFSSPCVRHAACYHGLVKVGVIGLGFMGATHLNAFKAIDGVEIAAVHPQIRKALEGDLRGAGGNLGREGGLFDFSARQQVHGLARPDS